MVAPKGNSYALGNSGGAPRGNSNAEGHGAPAQNQNGAKHHIYSNDPGDVLKHLEENEPEAYEWVQAKFSSYLEDAPFPADSAKADQLLQIVTAEYSVWCGRGIQVRDGLLKKTHIKGSDGELVEVEDEHSINQPTNRLEKTVTRRLKELGILDDPDSQQAEAMALSNESYTIDLGDGVDADADGVEEEAKEEGVDTE